MSTLYLRLPSAALAGNADAARGLGCRYALVASGKMEREGVAAIQELSATLAEVERVTLLLAASDVVLLRLKIPPLSSARLRAALPNLVEDHLIGDPADSVIAAGGASADGMRTVAVVQRAWLEDVAAALARYGVRRMTAVPAQLCLPFDPARSTVAVEAQQGEVHVTLRLSEHEGIGLAMPAGSSAGDVLEAIGAVARDAPLTLWIPASWMNDYRSAVQTAPALAARTSLMPESWSCWLDGADRADVNLLSGSSAAHVVQERAWRQWRWPAALAAGVLAINVIGLYTDWWQMKGESDRLRAAMLQSFRSAYPNESVILDPLAQMKQKISLSRRASGELAPDDFLFQLAAFADAWTSVAPRRSDGKPPRIAALEFHDRSLLVRTDADLPEQMASELKARGLSLARAGADAWQMRRAK